MHFFLQGPSGLGKSFLLRTALQPYAARLRGFVVQRLYQGQAWVGFRALPLRGEIAAIDSAYEPETMGSDGIFMLRGQRDQSVLERLIADVETECRQPDCALILLDEVGGIELTSPLFMAALQRLLDLGKPCLGVFKSRANLSRLAQNQKLGEEYEGLHRQLETLLQAKGTLLSMDGTNRTEIEEALRRYLDNL